MNSESQSIKFFIRKKAEFLGIDSISFCGIGRLKGPHAASVREGLPSGNFRSVISAALSYRYDSNLIASSTPGYIARYTSANFYRILSDKLKELARGIYLEFGHAKKKNEFARIFVNSKINDKSCAYLSGLGYIAKNSLIMMPLWGTSAVIGEIFIDIDIEDEPINTGKCGGCRSCMDACPTGAMRSYGIIEKSKCLQHLTTSRILPEKINDTYLRDLWGRRFYGCTECTDACPANSGLKSGDISGFTGFIGNSFDIEDILGMKKGDFKIRFAKNQLSAGWIDEAVHVRNALLSAANQGKTGIIREYKTSLDYCGWNEDDKTFIKDFIKNLL